MRGRLNVQQRFLIIQLIHLRKPWLLVVSRLLVRHQRGRGGRRLRNRDV